mmetsp:Transcript_134723/g.430422  ORF Transcript_134723/g.430422 Transcript_134723/m.430422 type:complete len:446 (-) Transcript_134723:529-1866(-)
MMLVPEGLGQAPQSCMHRQSRILHVLGGCRLGRASYEPRFRSALLGMCQLLEQLQRAIQDVDCSGAWPRASSNDHLREILEAVCRSIGQLRISVAVAQGTLEFGENLVLLGEQQPLSILGLFGCLLALPCGDPVDLVQLLRIVGCALGKDSHLDLLRQHLPENHVVHQHQDLARARHDLDIEGLRRLQLLLDVQPDPILLCLGEVLLLHRNHSSHASENLQVVDILADRGGAQSVDRTIERPRVHHVANVRNIRIQLQSTDHLDEGSRLFPPQLLGGLEHRTQPQANSVDGLIHDLGLNGLVDSLAQLVQVHGLAGGLLCIAGRLAIDAALCVHGDVAGRRRALDFEAGFAPQAEAHDASRLHACRAVRHDEGEDHRDVGQLGAETEELPRRLQGHLHIDDTRHDDRSEDDVVFDDVVDIGDHGHLELTVRRLLPQEPEANLSPR